MLVRFKAGNQLSSSTLLIFINPVGSVELILYLKPPAPIRPREMGNEDKIHHISSAIELQELMASTTYVAVDFFADWCPPCKTIAPVFESLASTHATPGILGFAKVNVDHVQEAARTYRVTAMPTFLFFKEGKQVAVNGQVMIQGADPRSLGAAIEKLGGLAAKRAAA